MRRLLLACSMLISGAASAMQDTGKLVVAPQVMAGKCITMVSPQTEGAAFVSKVVVRVVIAASGKVLPVRVISGSPALQVEAMNAVRLWRYRPLIRDDAPVDVVTDVEVTFEPGKPGGLISHPNH